MKGLRILFVLVLIAGIITGCGAGDEIPETQVEDVEGIDGQSSLPAQPDEDKLVAEFNGTEVTMGDFVAEIDSIPEEYKMNLLSSPGGLEMLLERYVEFRLVTKKIEETGYLETIKDEIQQMEDSVVVSTFTEMKKQELSADVEVSEEEIEEYFQQNKEEFSGGGSVHAGHILLDEEAGEEVAYELRNKIIEGEVEFEEAAKNMSVCPSGEEGGDLGQFSKGQMVPEFEEVAFSLEENEISEPVKTSFGWHLIKCYSTSGSDDVELDEVRPQIKSQLQQQKGEQAFGKWKKSLIGDEEVEYHESGSHAASLDGEPIITQEQVDREIANLPEHMKAHYMQGENRIMIVQALVERHMMKDIAYETGVQDRPEVVNQVEETLKNFVVEQFISDYVEEESVISDDQLREYYEENNEVYTGKYIFLSKQVKDENEIKELISEIEEKYDSHDFEELASEYSDDPSAQEGGDIGSFMKDEIFPEISKKLDGIEVGQRTGFVEIPAGFADVLITDIQEAEFEKIKDRLEQALSSKMKNEAYENLMADLREEYNLKIYSENLM
ncbi:MAG: peptidylprolyl isomerase [Candidatus Muiribacteriota bacterium]